MESRPIETVIGFGNQIDPRDHGSEGISLAWYNLSYTIRAPGKEPADLLQKASGIVFPGEVMAVIGPSGAGKSTLLDTLSGRKDSKNMTGAILLNGREDRIKYVSAYVMQDDALLGILTVRENIMYAAKLCLPANLTDTERERRVNKIITDFGLERIADTKVGTPFVRGVSGGERRRVSIAAQIIDTPQIIFLDEPTSGLDSTSAYNVIRAIVQMARARKLTVVATIHQPNTDTYSLFDKILLLARGKTIYFGSREDAPNYFAHIGHPVPNYANPADFYMGLLNTDFGAENSESEKLSSTLKRVKQLAQAFSDSQEMKQIVGQIQQSVQEASRSNARTGLGDVAYRATFARSFIAQTQILVSRGMLNAKRNVLVFWIRVAMYIAMAFLMGTTWFVRDDNQKHIEDRFSAHFFAVAFLAFMSVAGIPGFLEERLVFQRERANGSYRVGAYVLANTLVSIPFVFIISFSFTAVAYYWIGLNPALNQFLTYLTFLFLALYVAESMVVFVSTLIPIFVAALTIASFMNGFFMIVQGYFVQKKNIPSAWLWGHYIDYQKYAFEAMVYNDFTGLNFTCDAPAAPGNPCFCLFPNPDGPDGCSFSGDVVLEHYGYSNVHKAVWAAALINMILAYRIGTYIILRMRKPKQ